ncbi:MAG TPA: ABC transporter permease [Bryobacteraceae bacterium]|nr:ABC transporter permease [Bryobacteraceae bacterium]
MMWWQRLWRRQQMDEQLDKEVRFHLEHYTDDLIARGHSPEEARRQATLDLGGAEQVKEECRDARGTRWLEDLWQDLRYSLRTLRQKPGFSAVALVTLAMGIGATTVMFTVINGVLLKPLPYPHPDRLVSVYEQTDWSSEYGNRWAFAYPNFQDCVKQAQSLSMAAWVFAGGTLSAPGEPEELSGAKVSAQIFSVLGVPLHLGRAFVAEEDQPGAPPVAIISYALWQRRFSGSSSVLGTSVTFDAKPYVIVGVTPEGFRLDGEERDVMTPLGQDIGPGMQDRSRHRNINALARLQPDVTLAQAQTELNLIGRHLSEQYPQSNRGRTFVAEPLRPDVGDVQSTLWLLLGAVSLVLLIACANVASLLLARAVSRERELAMRIALGAGRGRLVRQCLTESAVLGLAGGVLAVVLAVVGIRPFVLLWPGSLPRAEEVHIDWRVLLFALMASLLSGLLFGIAPAVRAPVRRLEQVLRAGGRSLAGSSRRMHGGLVASEIALAVVLLVSAGMLGRTLLRLSSLDPGMNVRNLLVTRMAISPSVLDNPGRIRAAWQDLLDRAARVPGVQAVTLLDTVPMRQGNNQLGYWMSAALPADKDMPLALATSVTPEYLKVMGIPLREGRFLTDRDRIGGELVVVIDEVLAQRAFGGQDPVGRHLWIRAMSADPVRVVGVVGHVRHWGLATDDQAQVRAQVYYPLAQVPDRLLRQWSSLMSIAARTNVAPRSMVEPLRRAIRGASNDQVLYAVQTMEELVSDSLARQRFLLLLFAIFAGLAMLLACVGIYGVMAYLTGRRVPEIGVRMALGADAGTVVRLVLRQSLGMILTGAGIGAVAALIAGRLLVRLVDGMQATDPATFVVMVVALVLAALFASFVPARRASRVDPLSALRQE